MFACRTMAVVPKDASVVLEKLNAFATRRDTSWLQMVKDVFLSTLVLVVPTDAALVMGKQNVFVTKVTSWLQTVKDVFSSTLVRSRTVDVPRLVWRRKEMLYALVRRVTCYRTRNLAHLSKLIQRVECRT